MTGGLPGEGVAAQASTGHLLLLIATAVVLLFLLRAVIWAGLRFPLGRTSRWAAGFRDSRFWVRTRLGPGYFVGLLLILLAIAALLAAALFGGLADEVLKTGGVARIDATVNAALAPYRAPWLLDTFLWFTNLGSGAALAGMTVTAMGFLWANRRPGLILPLWVTLAGAEATTWIGKYAIGRARPVLLEGVATIVSPSFPSAHASGATAVLGFIAYAVIRGLPGQRERFEVAYWTAVLVALVGFSRVFLGVHFATDVAGGFLAGGFWLLVGFTLAAWMRVVHGSGW